MMRQAQESYRQEYASMPYDGPVYGCRREELMLPMQDGVRLYTEIFKPEGLAQFPVLIQRSCYPNQQPLYEINGVELTRRGYGYVVQTCRGTGKSEGHWNPTSMSARMAAIPCSGSTTSLGREHRLFRSQLSGPDRLGHCRYRSTQGQGNDADGLWHRPFQIGL